MIANILVFLLTYVYYFHSSSTAGDESEEHPPNIHQAEQLPTTLGETTFNMSSKSPAEVAILLPQNDQFNFAQTLARKIHSVEITKLSSDTGSLVRKLFSAQFVGENLILL